MAHLRDGAGQVISRRVRREARRKGHILGRFNGDRDNDSDETKLGATYIAECLFCGFPVLICFSPFDRPEDELDIQTVRSRRFGHVSDRRCVVSKIVDCKGG